MTDLLAVYLSRVKAILDQSPETKLRHVRDSAYWGMPDGTPIVAMKRSKAHHAAHRAEPPEVRGR